MIEKTLNDDFDVCCFGSDGKVTAAEIFRASPAQTEIKLVGAYAKAVRS